MADGQKAEAPLGRIGEIDISPKFEPLVTRVDQLPKPGSKGQPGSGEHVTKEAYSPYVSAVAFGAMKRDLGRDLLSADKWDPKTPEQKWWTQAMPAAYSDLGSLPKGVEIKSKASIGTPKPVNDAMGMHLEDSHDPRSMYIAGSINVTDKWDAKAKHMTMLDQKGNPIKNGDQEKYFDSVYKDGSVFNVNGQKVFQVENNKETGLKTYLIPNPGNLKGGADITQYAQSMVDRAKNGQPGKVEFPMYDKNVAQNLDGLVGLGVKNSDLYIAQAQMNGTFQANEKGQRSFEKQGFEVTMRSMDMDPPAERMNRPFIVAQVAPNGKVFLSAAINPADMKRPKIEGLDK